MVSVIAKLFGRGEIDCGEVRRLSSDYIEQQLPPNKSNEVKVHLAGCGPCRAFVETLASTIDLITRLPRISAPAGFKRSILERIQRERARRED